MNHETKLNKAYFSSVLVLMFILPVASGITDWLLQGKAPLTMPLIGKWFIFWAVGARLFLAGC